MAKANNILGNEIPIPLEMFSLKAVYRQYMLAFYHCRLNVEEAVIPERNKLFQTQHQQLSHDLHSTSVI